MADETNQTQAPVVGAEIKEDAVKAPFVYYFSDPDATDPMLHHLEIPSFYDLSKSADGLPWHWHIEKPDESLKDAIWSNDVNGWIENSKNAQSEIIAQAQQAIDNLSKKNQEFDQKTAQVDKTLQEVQAMQQTSSQQSAMLTKQLGALTESNQNMAKMMVQLQSTMQGLVKQTATNSTNNKQNTEVTNNGGNK